MSQSKTNKTDTFFGYGFLFFDFNFQIVKMNEFRENEQKSSNRKAMINFLQFSISGGENFDWSIINLNLKFQLIDLINTDF